MNVLQIVPYINDESSGPSYSVPGLCDGLVNAECDVELFVLGKRPDRTFAFPISESHACHFPSPRLGRSSEMRSKLFAAAATADVIHNHSFWMLPNVYPYQVIKKIRAAGKHAPKLVNSPRGTFSEWALSYHSFRKYFFGRFVGQYNAMKATDMWHATSEREYADIRRLGYRQPVCILPNGIDLPEEKFVRTRKMEMSSRRRMYFLSRIHPTKNIELLLRVWAVLEGRFADWDLAIVGPDKNNTYADQLKALAHNLGCRRVKFMGELNGVTKQEFVLRSECIVLPTHSENFGMVIAEALACGTAAICSHGAPWEGLNRERCGWWVPMTGDAFEMAMSEAMSKSREELIEIGSRGRDWMRRDFSWDGVGVKMKAAYEWLVNPEVVEKPEWVFVMK